MLLQATPALAAGAEPVSDSQAGKLIIRIMRRISKKHAQHCRQQRRWTRLLRSSCAGKGSASSSASLPTSTTLSLRHGLTEVFFQSKPANAQKRAGKHHLNCGRPSARRSQLPGLQRRLRLQQQPQQQQQQQQRTCRPTEPKPLQLQCRPGPAAAPSSSRSQLGSPSSQTAWPQRIFGRCSRCRQSGQCSS